MEKNLGIDGFPAEFFKVFWGRIKYFMLTAFNCSLNIIVCQSLLGHALLHVGQKMTSLESF